MPQLILTFLDNHCLLQAKFMFMVPHWRIPSSFVFVSCPSSCLFHVKFCKRNPRFMDSVLYICIIMCVCIYVLLCIHVYMYLFQVKFCKRNPGFMDSVRLGAVRAIDECQYQVSSTLVFFPCITMMRWYMGISVIQM